MIKKIAFIGTHGTGKTTLAHELVTKLKKKGIDAEFLGEIAKTCPFPINEGTTKKSQVWIILNQIIQELEAEEKTSLLICDRSVLDGYCYYVNKFGRSSFLEPIVLKHLGTYSHLIKVPIREGFLKKDKIRSTNENFQKDIDTQFNKLLKRLKIKHICLKREESEKDEEIIKRVLNTLE